MTHSSRGLPVRELATRLNDLIRIKETIWPPDMGNLDEEVLRGILAHLRVRTGIRRASRRSTVERLLGGANARSRLADGL